jgi:hypothetical protein
MMPFTIDRMPSLTISPKDGSEKVQFTYSGGTPGDGTPAGTLLEMMIATLEKDFDKAKSLMTEKSLEGTTPGSPPGDVEVRLGEVKYEGELAVIETLNKAGEQEMTLPFILAKENGQWRVDLGATMERFMGPAIEQLGAALQEGMSKMGEAMGEAMKGMAEGMSEAFSSMSLPAEDAPPAHPDLANFRQGIIDMTGIKWRVEADWWTFGLPDDHTGPIPGEREELLPELFEGFLKGVDKYARGGGASITMLDAVKTIRLRRDIGGTSRFYREDATVTYALGGNEGEAEPIPSNKVALELHKAIENILDG